ncbi:hypothetical protein J6590_027163 [Homalodisca vitripennis]|nr:hypothetical protein J6590_027163 [Homalodisca vitripennis]
MWRSYSFHHQPRCRSCGSHILSAINLAADHVTLKFYLSLSMLPIIWNPSLPPTSEGNRKKTNLSRAAMFNNRNLWHHSTS